MIIHYIYQTPVYKGIFIKMYVFLAENVSFTIFADNRKQQYGKFKYKRKLEYLTSTSVCHRLLTGLYVNNTT